MNSPTPIGADPTWRACLALAKRAARRPWPVLIVGETGTGKELVARECHSGAGPFVPVNCGAIHHERVEHDLFGHEKGAFTGAERSSPGHFRNAHGGTVFLDELGDLPLPAQVKLLRVLQEGTVRPVGASTETPVDVRVVAATHRDVVSAVNAGTFREDLWHRLSVTVIKLPSLRERKASGDIERLACAFLARDRAPGDPTEFDVAALRALREHSWPGNVRELEATVRRALVRHEGRGRISVDDLGLDGGEATRAVSEPRGASGPVDYEAAVREHGSQVKAARALGIARTTLQRRLDAIGQGVGREWAGSGQHNSPESLAE